jgi:hypothetical protein
MAAPKFKPMRVFRQPKWPVYEALYKLNAAFESIALEIERLDDYEAIPLETLRLYRATAEELRSAMNSRITEVLHARELKDWSKYGNARIALEKRAK